MIKQNGTCNVKDPTNHSTNHLQPTMAIIWSHSNHQASLPPLLVVALKLGITHQTQKSMAFCACLLLAAVLHSIAVGGEIEPI